MGQYDEETGETIYSEMENIWETDRETGEPNCNKIKSLFTKTKFNVPKMYLTNPRDKPTPRCIKETYTLVDSKKFLHFKEEIILGYNKTSHRMFLIPSLFLFFKWTALFIAVSEIVLHIWAHKKNTTNNDKNVYYRSPLHILTSQFCAVCRSHHDYDHINRLHEKTRRLHENLSRVSKSFS